MRFATAVREVSKQPRSRWFYVLRTLAIDLALIHLALLLSFGLVYDFQFSPAPVLAQFSLPVTVAGLVLLVTRRVYRINPRYVGIYDLLNLLIVGAGLGVTLFVAEWALGYDVRRASELAPSVLFGFLSLFFLAGTRVYQRMLGLRQMMPTGLKNGGRYRRVLIVGAGDAGETILRELTKIGPTEYGVVGFVDDNTRRFGTAIHGVPVIGRIDDLPELVSRTQADEILIAMPEAVGEEMNRIFRKCQETRARIRTLPSFSHIVHGDAPVLPLMRELQVEDLLRRASVKAEMAPVARYVSGERVLITGGGGSIGSELARQIATLTPASLVLLGKGENSVFEVDQELRHKGIYQPTPVICDVRDPIGMENVYGQQYPSVVFHAAAHKHVPLMEAVPIEAIQNNVFGTLNAAELAVRNGVKRFILVSTDKAVNPSNVMGATKRVAEMIVSALGARSETSFSVVRFGNVLGSRGSLIPTLKRQIRSGGPVTITHPEMTRFFMTIPEAVQLIVQAGAMGERGEIFILDMGEAVSIVELAKDMIRMHGLVPNQDVQIKYTGIRPGEKIHEELAFDMEDLKASAHEKIRMVANNQPVEWDWLRVQLAELRRLCDAGDANGARAFLMELAWGKNLPPVLGNPATPGA